MRIDNRPYIVVVGGPTGIGKTSAAIKLAQAFGGEIINADSMQIYRYMDVGTAKPTHEEQSQVRHYMVDIVDPDESFDAARFAVMADGHIRELNRQGKLPIVAGGTGLYIKALVNGLFRADPADPEILKKLEKEAAEKGSMVLYERLEKCDPRAAERIHPNDAFRIIRALETFETTGCPISEYHDKHRFSEQPYRVLKIGLSMEREILYGRINRRVDIMIDEGLLEEVKSLLDRGYSQDLKSMRSLGYRHMVSYINNELPWDEAIRTLKRDTRRYAKRQMTWFRADTELSWIQPEEIMNTIPCIQSFLGQ